MDSSTLVSAPASNSSGNAARRIFPRQRRVQPRFETAQNLVAIDQAFFSRDTASQASGPVNCRFGFQPVQQRDQRLFRIGGQQQGPRAAAWIAQHLIGIAHPLKFARRAVRRVLFHFAQIGCSNFFLSGLGIDFQNLSRIFVSS